MDNKAHFIPFPSIWDSLRSVDGSTGRLMFDETTLRSQCLICLFDQEARPAICATSRY